MGERRRVPVRGRLTLLYLNPERPSDPIQIFSRCNPGTAADTDPWLDDPERVQREWVRQFEAPLDQALEMLLTPSESSTSPILETVRGLTWRSDFTQEQAERRIVLVSDMLQNSVAHSMYAQEVSERTFEAFERRPRAELQIPDLNSVDVDLHILRSEEALPYQDEAFESFWHDYFGRTGAELIGG